jgi:regulator of protease activity HflC (stomatin/prohibitin superfamily)
VDQILNNRTVFRECVDKRAQDLIEEQQLGIAVEQLTVTPYVPGSLKEKFEQVLLESDKRADNVNQAQSYKNTQLTKALANAHSRTNAARVESETYVALAQEEAAQFTKVLPKFQKDPALYMNLRLAQTMGRVLTNADETFFNSKSSDGLPMEVRVLLNRELKEKLPTPVSDNLYGSNIAEQSIGIRGG